VTRILRTERYTGAAHYAITRARAHTHTHKHTHKYTSPYM